MNEYMESKLGKRKMVVSWAKAENEREKKERDRQIESKIVTLKSIGLERQRKKEGSRGKNEIEEEI